MKNIELKAIQMLKAGKAGKCISSNTVIRILEDGTAVLKLYDSDIIRYNPRTWHLSIRTNGWRTRLTLSRLRTIVQALRPDQKGLSNNEIQDDWVVLEPGDRIGERKP